VVDSELSDRMANMRVEQLSDIAFASPEDGIREDFIAAARAELDRRGVSSDVRAEMEDHVAAVRAEDSERAIQPLGWLGIVLFLLLGPMLLISVISAISLYATGYKTKAKDALTCILLSFGLYGLLGLILRFTL
jgi:hypothetical protein